MCRMLIYISESIYKRQNGITLSGDTRSKMVSPLLVVATYKTLQYGTHKLLSEVFATGIKLN